MHSSSQSVKNIRNSHVLNINTLQDINRHALKDNVGDNAAIVDVITNC